MCVHPGEKGSIFNQNYTLKIQQFESFVSPPSNVANRQQILDKRLWGKDAFQWLTPIILATWRQRSGGWQFKASPRQIVQETLLKKTSNKNRVGGVAQGVRPESKPELKQWIYYSITHKSSFLGEDFRQKTRILEGKTNNLNSFL
jgi:hypothetical protein